MTLQIAPTGLDYERNKRFSKVCSVQQDLLSGSRVFLQCTVSQKSLKELVAAFLVKDRKKRPSSDKLLKHHFFKHARPHDYLARTILDGLSPLGDRFRMLKVSCSTKLLVSN